MLAYGMFLACVALLFPWLMHNRLDYRRKIKTRPFAKSKWVELNENHPAVHRVINGILAFPLGPEIYRILPALNGNILQVGCGTGLLNRYLQKAGGRNGHLFNLDANALHLRYGLEKGALENILHAKIEKVPLADQTFDIIVFARSYHHVLNHRQALRECERLLKPGGVIYIADMVCPPRFTDDRRAVLMNTDNDGIIWRFSRNTLEQNLRLNLPASLRVRSRRYVRLPHVTNYNPLYPHADALIEIVKEGGAAYAHRSAR